MAMVQLDPLQLFRLIEERMGRRPARFLLNATIYLAFVAFSVWAIGLIWKHGVVPIFLFVRDILGVGVTLDNLETLFITFALTLLLFAMIVVGSQHLILRFLRRRTAPQWVIDKVANFRSDGIRILNDRPSNDENLKRWETTWRTWGQGVADYLGNHFSHAERLAFERLGLIPERQFGRLAFNSEHAHYLMQLAKQLTILEDLIQRQLERR